MSPMERTKAELKKHGIWHEIVERWYPRSKKYPFGLRKDLFSIIDLIALDHGIVGVQVCGSDWMGHYRKIMVEKKENTTRWLSNDARLEIWGWRKRKKKRGMNATYWSPRIADVILVKDGLYWEERNE
jgi:hypothetical protein